MRRINLERLQPNFKVLVTRYLRKNKMKKVSLSWAVGIPRQHLSNLLSPVRSRKLSAYYVFKFITRNVFSVRQIYDHRPESQREARFWKVAKEYQGVVKINAKKKGK
jgi:hypothetical protein